MNRRTNKQLNRLIATLAPLVTTALEQQNRRERARTLRQARALRTAPQGRPVAMTQAEIAIARTLPMARHVVATAYDVPLNNRPIEDLQGSWDDWDRWTYGGFDPSYTAQQFAKARNGPLRREVWNLFRRGMTTPEIARSVAYRLEHLRPEDATDSDVMFASPSWVQQVLDEGIEIVKKRNGIQ
jgi:hypothetical protein